METVLIDSARQAPYVVLCLGACFALWREFRTVLDKINEQYTRSVEKIAEQHAHSMDKMTDAIDNLSAKVDELGQRLAHLEGHTGIVR